MANVDLTISSGVSVNVAIGGSILGGSDKQVLFNDGGAMAGDPALTWDKTPEIFRVGLSSDLVSAFFHGRVGHYVKDNENVNANISLNMKEASVHLLTATGDFEINLSNLVGGYAISGVILLTMDGAGGHTVTLKATTFTVELNGSDAIDNAAGAKNFIAFMYNGISDVYYSITNEA